MEKRTTKTEKAVQMYAERMIETIETLKSGWRKTWFTEGDRENFVPDEEIELFDGRIYLYKMED